jgi:aspartate-semialdehyde dehydrogenase
MKKTAAVIGATGVAGQQVLAALADHPLSPGTMALDIAGGMLTSVGRVRADHALSNGIKYMLVSHHTKMGAAKGAILVAEYLVHEGHI